MKTITVTFSFDETWNGYEDVDNDLIIEDAIRELADGVTYEIKE